MPEWGIQIILFIFGGGFLFAGYWMIQSNQPWPSISIFWFTVLVISLASVGPDTIKILGAKWGADGGQFGFDRYQPTQQERNLTLKISQDKPSSEILIESKAFLKHAKTRTPGQRSPEDYLALATDNWRNKNYDSALADAFAGLALNPESIRIKAILVHRKASIYDDSGSKELAIKFYNRAMELDPAFAWLHNNLGRIYLDQGKLKEAEAELNKAIELDPKDFHALKNLGSVFSAQGKLAEAKMKFEEALRLNPDYAEAKKYLEDLKMKKQ